MCFRNFRYRVNTILDIDPETLPVPRPGKHTPHSNDGDGGGFYFLTQHTILSSKDMSESAPGAMEKIPNQRAR